MDNWFIVKGIKDYPLKDPEIGFPIGEILCKTEKEADKIFYKFKSDGQNKPEKIKFSQGKTE